MVNFIERTNPATTTKVRTAVPVVYIGQEALQKMFIYTEEVKDEVGWLGTVDKIVTESGQEVYHITDTFMLKQKVHGTTTEIDPEGLTELATELLKQPDGMEIWNKTTMWGHSHVNMGITPSGQDNKQMEEFEAGGHKYFLRLICNKKGELGIDVYDYEKGLEFHNVPWKKAPSAVGMSETEIRIEAMKAELAELEKKRQDEIKGEVDEKRSAIQEEIKSKVSKLTYSYGGKTGGSTYQQSFFTAPYASKSQITGDEDIEALFSTQDLLNMADLCATWSQLRETLDTYHVNGKSLTELLSYTDVQKIWNYVLALQPSGTSTWYGRRGIGY